MCTVRPLRHVVLWWLLIPVVLRSLEAPRAAAQGRLGQLKSEVRNGPSSDKKKKKKQPPQPESDDDHHDDHHGDHHDDEEDELFHWFVEPVLGPIVSIVATSPFWVPRAVASDQGFADRDFLTYPYQDGFPGYWLHDADRSLMGTYYPWLLRVRGEYGEDFDAIRRVSMGMLYETRGRWGLDASLDYYREWVPGYGRDDMWLGDVNVVYRFAQADNWVMRTGLGANYLTGSGSTEWGFNFTYGGDWLPARPWIFSANIDVGSLGKVGFFHGRATVGVNVRKVEFYSGYDYLDVGSIQIGNVIGGIRFWY